MQFKLGTRFTYWFDTDGNEIHGFECNIVKLHPTVNNYLYVGTYVENSPALHELREFVRKLNETIEKYKER